MSYKRTVGVAYFSTNLDIHEMREEFGNDLLGHVGIVEFPRFNKKLPAFYMNNCDQFHSILSNIRLKPGITKEDIVGNLCGNVKQVTSSKRRDKLCDGRRVRERNNAFRCTIYGEKYIKKDMCE